MAKLVHDKSLTISLPWQVTKANLKLTHVDNQFACFADGKHVKIDGEDTTLKFRHGETTRILMVGVNTGGPYKFIGSVQFDSPGHDIEINVYGPETIGLAFWSELVVERK